VLYTLGNGGRGALCHLLHPDPTRGLLHGLTPTKAADFDFAGPAVLARISEALPARTPAALPRQGRWQKAEISSTSTLLKQVTAKSPAQGITKVAQATDLTGAATEPTLHEGLFCIIAK